MVSTHTKLAISTFNFKWLCTPEYTFADVSDLAQLTQLPHPLPVEARAFPLSRSYQLPLAYFWVIAHMRIPQQPDWHCSNSNVTT